MGHQRIQIQHSALQNGDCLRHGIVDDEGAHNGQFLTLNGAEIPTFLGFSGTCEAQNGTAVLSIVDGGDKLATGGIDENNVADYLKAGAVGAGIGGNLVNLKWVNAGEYEKITEVARLLVAAVK